MPGIGDVHGRVEIRLAGAEADDVLALGFQARGARGDRERRRGLDALDTFGESDGHGEYRLAANPAKVREGILRCNSRTGVSEPRPFDLQAAYQPAGDQPAAIAALVDGIQSGLAHQTLLGVTGSGKTYSIANVIQTIQRPTLVLAHNKTLAAQLYGEFKEYFPRNSVEYFVSYYDYYQPEAYVPSSDTYIEKDASINEHIEQMRLSATKALLERPDSIIVATVSAIYGLGDPESYLKMVLHLVRGDRMDHRQLLRRLADMQYTRNELDLRQGTFRVRGDVVDIFPAESERDAVRVQFFDEEIESLAFFDPLTGEVLRKVPRLTVFPSTHYVTPRERLLARGRRDQGRVARRGLRSCAPRTSWSRRSDSSSARCSTSR